MDNIIKVFVFETDSSAIVLQNEDEFRPFIEEKIAIFREPNAYTNKEAHLQLFQEILEIIDFDVATADFSHVATHGHFHNLDSLKEQFINGYNIIFILGTIYLNVFDLEDNRIRECQDGATTPISTSQMFDEAYRNLRYAIATNINGHYTPQYGATITFATLFEHDLKSAVNHKYIIKYLEQVNIHELNDSDIALYHYLKQIYINKEDINSGHDGFYKTTTGLWEFLDKYDLIKEHKTEIKKLIMGKHTLTQFLKSPIFTQISDERFVKMCRRIFDNGVGNDEKKGSLGIRNRLAHTKYGYLNFYHINVTVVLYMLFFMITFKIYIKNP